MAQEIIRPTAEDSSRIADQIAGVLKIAAEHFGDVAFTHTDSDLVILQRLLDNRFVGAEQSSELQSMGLVFGEILARRADLIWVTVVDSYGRDPALRFRDTSLILFPMTMISKRVENGQRVDVAELMAQMEREVAKLKAEGVVNAAHYNKPWWKFW